MKKLLSLILAVGMVGMFAGMAFAEGSIAYSRGQDARVKVEIMTGAATADSTSNINAGDLILGFTVSGSAATGGGLYDTTSVGAAVSSGTGVFGEAYIAAGTAETIIFPTPYLLTSTLYSVMPTTGVIVVYYEDHSP
jgi:hypothetical protein